MSNYTQTADRPDLTAEALKINTPEGYIGSKVMPVVNVATRSGKIYFATYDTPGAAQTDRTTGDAPTGTQLANDNDDFSCGETIKRGSIAEEEVKQMGDIARADVAGARYAVRSVMEAVEGGIADLVLKSSGDADKTFAAATFLEDAQDAIDAAQPYGGKLALVASTRCIKLLVKAILADSTLAPVFCRIVSGSDPTAATRGLAFASWTSALATLLGVDAVFAGADSVWAKAESGRESRFAIGKFSEGADDLEYKYSPIFGVNVVYLPDPAMPEFPFRVTSVADYSAKNNHYDAQIWNAPMVLNEDAVTVFEIPAAEAAAPAAGGAAGGADGQT